MHEKRDVGLMLSGFLAGAVNGLFGAGGGMVLIPLLTLLGNVKEEQLFSTSIAIILPICLVSLAFSAGTSALTFGLVLPYLIGSAIGGLLAGIWGRRIPAKWLHRGLGILILWGGIRYLC